MSESLSDCLRQLVRKIRRFHRDHQHLLIDPDTDRSRTLTECYDWLQDEDHELRSGEPTTSAGKVFGLRGLSLIGSMLSQADEAMVEEEGTIYSLFLELQGEALCSWEEEATEDGEGVEKGQFLGFWPPPEKLLSHLEEAATRLAKSQPPRANTSQQADADRKNETYTLIAAFTWGLLAADAVAGRQGRAKTSWEQKYELAKERFREADLPSGPEAFKKTISRRWKEEFEGKRQWNISLDWTDRDK